MWGDKDDLGSSHWEPKIHGKSVFYRIPQSPQYYYFTHTHTYIQYILFNMRKILLVNSYDFLKRGLFPPPPMEENSQAFVLPSLSSIFLKSEQTLTSPGGLVKRRRPHPPSSSPAGVRASQSSRACSRGRPGSSLVPQLLRVGVT